MITSKYKYLTKEDIEFFAENGYLYIKSIIAKDDCEKYVDSYVKPALKNLANLDESNPSTWFMEHNAILHKYVTQGPLSCDDGSGIPIGLMIRDESNTKDDLNPIPTENGGNWKNLLDNERLNGILDELHSPGHPMSCSPNNKRRWEYIHPNNVGWIHVRLPLSYDDRLKKYCNSNNYQQRHNNSTRHPHSQKFHIPFNEGTWHVDGGHFNPHKLSSLDQSIILLPMLRDVKSDGGGNTLLLAGSHVNIARHLYDHRQSTSGGIDKNELNSYCEDLSKAWSKDFIVEAAPCCAGDILLLHPFLVHSAGWNTREVEKSDAIRFRLTFNIGLKWKESSFIQERNIGEEGLQQGLLFDSKKMDQMSIVEWTISKSIHATQQGLSHHPTGQQ